MELCPNSPSWSRKQNHFGSSLPFFDPSQRRPSFKKASDRTSLLETLGGLGNRARCQSGCDFELEMRHALACFGRQCPLDSQAGKVTVLAHKTQAVGVVEIVLLIVQRQAWKRRGHSQGARLISRNLLLPTDPADHPTGGEGPRPPCEGAYFSLLPTTNEASAAIKALEALHMLLTSSTAAAATGAAGFFSEKAASRSCQEAGFHNQAVHEAPAQTAIQVTLHLAQLNPSVLLWIRSHFRRASDRAPHSLGDICPAVFFGKLPCLLNHLKKWQVTTGWGLKHQGLSQGRDIATCVTLHGQT